MEGDLPGTKIPIEMPPNQGISLNILERSDLKDGDIIAPLVKDPNKLGLVNQLYKVQLWEDGTIHLLPVIDDLGDEAKREKIIEYLLEAHKEEIKEGAFNAFRQALRRKPEKKLKAMEAESKKGKKSQTESRRGCMYWAIGDEEIVL